MAEITIRTVIEQAFGFLQEGKIDAAKKILEEETAKVEASGQYVSSRENAYFSFQEAMEEVMYQYDRHGNAEVHRVDEPISTLYLVFGSVLAGSGEIMRGQEALKKAMQWNPASCDVLLEYADTFRMLGDYEAYREVTSRAFHFAFLPDQVARCLDFVGNYFGLLKMWPESLAYYTLSLEYDADSPAVRRQAAYAAQQAGLAAGDISPQHMQEISKQYNIRLGADEGVIRLAQKLGHRAEENGDSEAAQYFLTIARGLEKDRKPVSKD